MTTTLLAVNGTLMRGLELNKNMQKAVCEKLFLTSLFQHHKYLIN